jgi:ribosome biogenesis GTPase / thiamine phosphate phosphatase
MTLEILGFNSLWKEKLQFEDISGFEVGRVALEHKERYIIKSAIGDFEAEITGNMRFSASSRSGFPAVGDWVLFKTFGPEFAIIYKILPRKNILERQAIGKHGDKQIISANIDAAFIMQAVDHDFNINRFERYLTICNTAKIEPILLLSKTDLINKQEITELVNELKTREKNSKLVLFSNKTKEGYKNLISLIEKGKTYCVIGSSGVGKSTLINNLTGSNTLKTNEISDSTNKGRHTTSHRELIVLENGGILIDTPGMRELGITENLEGIETTFETITKLASKCKFIDCSHVMENGCAIVKAKNEGIISGQTYNNYLKMIREQQWFQSTLAEKRKKDKAFGKMVKSILNNKNQS